MLCHSQNSEESQVWARYLSLQESTAIQSRFEPTFECATL